MDWFKNWFDSFYYHKLYRHRNMDEAQNFMDNILEFIQPEKGSRILDLACGKGRHSIYLNQKGYDVLGVDLSVNSINEANKNANSSLRFLPMDMRELHSTVPFDLVMNLFTSFGYFQTKAENIQVLRGVSNVLKSEGLLVIDFLNATKVINNLVPAEKQEIDGIDFTINRVIEDNTVVKKIEVNDQGKKYHFQERVSMFELSHFEDMFSESGFKLIHHFGNYHLDTFEPNKSDRLILVAQKLN